MEVYILDACSIIAYFKNEIGANRMADLFEKANCGECLLYLHRLNLYEIYYDFLRADGEEEAQKVIDLIEGLPIIKSNLMSFELFHNSAFFKTNFRVSLADSILLGMARQYGCVVVSADHHEFDIIETNGLLSFFWIR